MYACKKLHLNFKLRMQHIYFQEWLLIVFNRDLWIRGHGSGNKDDLRGMRFHHGTLSGFILHIGSYCRRLSRLLIAE